MQVVFTLFYGEQTKMKKFAGLLTAGLVAATLTACNDKEAKSDATKAQAPANNTVYFYILGLNTYQMVF